ncbi:MAG: thioredoxin domain-containing protein [Gemmatimonadota bacterium]|nr:thioredoxin domain-containing protein [Gemmatimonadota bacterium]
MSESSAGPPSDRPANRLASEKSPYLLQHAHNPVDWYPWSDEAFERARREDRPVFLSIGYATCHWCHVMESESFEDGDVAKLLNEHFVPVKVDREERPDLDAVYMTVCQLMTGRGGWPLTVLLTPEKKPFFAGTYFPRESAPGRVGMLELLPRLSRLWDERREDVEASAEAALEAVRETERRTLEDDGSARLDETTLRRGYDELQARFDRHQGGFGTAPKFPTPHQLLFLLRWHRRSGGGEALEMVRKTLVMMRRGGIFDHIGGGFHRYSTDGRWLVPHFEKMLYDQALLAMAYTELWWVTKETRFRRVADEVLEYVLRDLADPGGAFYSAEDADSEGREGAFYVWTREELDRLLTEALDEDAAALARRAFQVERRGNFADEATGVRTGENILHRRESDEELAEALGEELEPLRERLEAIRSTLFEARSRRERPLLDDKILTDWNGLMIAALAIAGRAFGEPAYTAAAERAADFLDGTLRDGDGSLLHRYRDGEAAIPAGAADHAFLAWGLLELYESTFEPRWLSSARASIDELRERFWDPDGAGVFNADEDRSDVPVRQKETYDGAMPSANAVTWYVLLRAGHLTGDASLLAAAARMRKAFAPAVARAPAAHTMWLVALDLSLGPTREVVIAGEPGAEGTRTLLAALRRDFRPRTSVLLKPPGATPAGEALVALAPFADGYEPVDGSAAAYVCTDFACQRPTSEISEMLDLLA